ncbi:6-phospho-beta-glucosidase [Salisediminibacterium selenitireducens]|uniref:Glycoside hydrolase family 4 n=1 Tax=Bacillus selenitireducens (strain ATCC 700615 / DSM 15326 / MLS10) TaxID=439292 RepID=D6XVV7_BACIE|nr:6-phospho-beta-glucosidase [Salisediminibacterium selenitireducens]ADH97730.1 glycoside hydrolase family 4 [[Bacillus] selenitireducens MLS10]
MAVNIAVIGGGSSYTPEIIEGLIDRYDDMPVRKITLVDVEEGQEKLNVITNLAKRMIARSGKEISIVSTLDLEQALKGADFVTSQIRVGGLDARSMDEAIPLRKGLVGQETNGAGGIFKAFRTIPVLMELSQAMAKICPDAWLINFTNPAGMVTEALLKYGSHKKVIGVCNIPFNMRSGIAEMFHVPVGEVEIEFIGLNHFIFGRRVKIGGVDRTSEALAKSIEKGVDYSPANIVSLGWTPELIRSLGMLPNPYHQYYFQTRDVIKKDMNLLDTEGTRADVVKGVEASLFETYRAPDLDVKPKELEQRGGAYYSDAACNLMVSLHTDRQDVQTVNTLNQGAVSDLPDDAVIEVNAVITEEGPKPVSVGKLPDEVRGIIQQMKHMEELTIKAAISGDYDDAYLALVMNPLVSDEKLAKDLLDELLDAHQSFLPQFHSREENV